ncbi:cytochrome c [Prosthecobacter fusiformis]|uniref:Cytochrome c n=1 Tax=Prosthecobacter fusiformis TaxID=48464 RepID=A0A4V3FE04_9BACT|nr:PSD1 and planctomycete cytochrome C domain-containing protein [Prosthecobacter fusiformis]TDU64040.1 cytochrome c [Prosthecobacter fusiformis]
MLALSAQVSAIEPESLKFFENKIRPILAESCFSCHGEEKQKGGLRVDNLAYLNHGGDSGPALIAHQPDESLLMKAVNYGDSDLEMPPDGKLPEDQIAALKQWIAMGAPWPEAEVASVKPARKPGEFTQEDKEWWAFQPVKKPAVPAAKAAGSNSPIDAFVQVKLAENGLEAAKEATPEELVRRVYFDLHGLPPTPEDVATFVAEVKAEKAAPKKAKSATAYERLVDKLLASPRYGERWGQHWLDLARYAESEGYRQDAYRPNVWPYRDYVIESFNTDKPYDQFMREQIAGDEVDPANPKVSIGTAFLRHSIYEYNQRDAETQWQNIMNEVTGVTADVFMGMSVQCAQCHDHKFDPILHKDYFRLQAFFSNIVWPEDKPLATPAEIKAYEEQLAAWKEAAKEPLAVIDRIIEPRIADAQRRAMEKFPAEVVAMWKKPVAERSAYEEQVVRLAWRQAEFERYRFKSDKIKDPEQSQLKAAQEQLAQFDSLKPKSLLTAFIIGETGGPPGITKFKARRVGDTVVNPGFLSILDPSDAALPEISPGSATTGRRTVLANWMTRADNPLTTRVIVNRVWQYHFGRGLVATPSDFGRLGEKPTHPELLDWLTSEFVEGGWKFKPLHKMILMSATYRQTAQRAPTTKELTTDPENNLLWRFLPRRLDAEQARDAALLASGELNMDMGGVSVPATQPRRSIYTRKIRNTQDEFLASLDAPPGFSSLPTRDSTTTATQSLLMINGDWPLERARAMAVQLLKSQYGTDAELVDRAYSMAFSRKPTATEKKDALSFLTAQRTQLKSELPTKPAEPPALASASNFFGTAGASRTAKTLVHTPGTSHEKLRVHETGRIEGNEFALEAVVNLNQVYPSASVRTIASRWDNSKSDRGWALGVTGLKSAYKPNNLIVQLSGDDFQGTLMYEVVASGLRIPEGKPYYVAAAINNEPAEGQKFGGTITFYARDLSDPKAEMQSVTVSHQVCGGYTNAERGLYVGGRDKDKNNLWHGAIARFAMRQGSLDGGKLMAWVGATDASCVVDVNADMVTEMLKGDPKTAWRWESAAAPVSTKGRMDPGQEAVTDLCHVLLNANEFFYLH